MLILMLGFVGSGNTNPDESTGASATSANSAPITTPSPPPAVAPERVAIELRELHYIAWEELFRGVRVHFVARIENTGNVPAEVRDIRYAMRDSGGALIEEGDVPHSFPQKLAPGQMGVIGRTVTADTARGPWDVDDVAIAFDVRSAEKPDNLLTIASVDAPDLSGSDVFVSGSVRNTGSKMYDDVRIAVILIDAGGASVGYSTADLPVDELPPGELARFATVADLPAEQLPQIAAVEVIAFDR